MRVCVYVFVYSVGGDGRLTPSNPHAHPYQQPPHHEKQSLAEQLKRTRDDEESQYLNQKMQAVIARLYCMTGQSKVQGACCVWVYVYVYVYTPRHESVVEARRPNQNRFRDPFLFTQLHP